MIGLLFSFSFFLTGKVPPVLASRALSQIPVLCGRSHGRVQHAPVHPQRVQSHRCQGKIGVGFLQVAGLKRAKGRKKKEGKKKEKHRFAMSLLIQPNYL